MVYSPSSERILALPAHNSLGLPSTRNPHAALSLNPCKTSIRAGSTESRERRRHDPYLMAQSRQRRAANLSRRQALFQEREESLGDPVETAPTQFIQELEAVRTSQIDGKEKAAEEANLSYFLSRDDFQGTLEKSKDLTSPPKNPNRAIADPELEMEAEEKHLQQHRNAQEAMSRIANLANGNTKDRVRVNIEKCIEKFGRHNTDKNLKPKPAAASDGSETIHATKTPRVGKDTGSSEVQIAILTEKILNLSRHLQGTHKDKHNKRNLRVLVHKRQKLLRYLRRKERGGPRWQHLVENLGLSDAAWKGEISM